MQGPFTPQLDRWRALAPEQRRAVKAVAGVAIGLVLIVVFGVWKTSALAIAAVVLLLVVPR
jgi:hypothetical protein